MTGIIWRCVCVALAACAAATAFALLAPALVRWALKGVSGPRTVVIVDESDEPGPTVR